MISWRLVSDVGGTNVRFARALDDGTLIQHRSYLVSQFPAFISAVRYYLDEIGGSAGCSGAAIGAAGPVDNGSVTLTNAHWAITEAEIRAEIGIQCFLVNDLEAMALCLPALSSHEFTSLGGPALNLTTAKRLLAANAGTGFGAATLLKTEGGWMPCPSEAGHMSLSLPEGLRDRFCETFVSVEHVLSGSGLANLYGIIANDKGPVLATDVFARADRDENCANAVRIFTDILGDVIGNLALGVAAWDGVFLCGTIAKGFAQVANVASLRQAFENKGVMSERMKRIPIALVTKENAALAGLAALPMHSH